MFGLLTKCLTLAICACVIAADGNVQPPPCGQIVQNPVMCTQGRFKKICAKECASIGNDNGVTTTSSSTTTTTTTTGGTTKVFTNNGHHGSNEVHTETTKPASSSTQHSTQGSSTAQTTTSAHSHENTETTVTNQETLSTKSNKQQDRKKKPPPPPKGKKAPKSNENNENSNGASEENHKNKKITKAPKGSKVSTTTTSTKSTNNNKNCNKIDPCVDLATANAGFRQRCQSAGIEATCLDKCRYDVTFDELKKAMLSKQCPLDGMRDYLKAGANQQDNRMCCQSTGVLDGKRAFCFPFCNPNGNEWPGPKEGLKYLPCASQLSAIMKCHWAGLTQ